METELEVAALIDPLIKSFKLLGNEWKYLFEIGVGEYLQSQTQKYYFTNTFLHRSEKVKFKDIYYPIIAKYKYLTTDFKNIESVFEEYRFVTLTGSAGSGKTTLIKYIFLTTISQKGKIPVLVELRNFNDYKGSFEKLITETILKLRLTPSNDTFKRALRSGKFLFLLDGYDEIFSVHKQEIKRQIEFFVDSYANNYFLITTRPGGGIENFQRFYDFEVAELTDSDVRKFIVKNVENKERREAIYSIIDDERNLNYREYLRNPLLLSMFILAFESHPEIPSRKSAFYRNVFDTLYSRHDGITKNSFPRERLTKLQRDDFETVLSIFSYLSVIEGHYSFTHEYLTDLLARVKKSISQNYSTENLIFDLRTSISILILDGFEYNFPHRSLQEYFAALFISKLPTDKKEKAYNKLISILRKSSNDLSLNFWTLCFELDEISFLSAFLIPELKTHIAELNDQTPKDLIRSYFRLFQLGFLFYSPDDPSEVEGLVIVYEITLFYSLVEFFDMFDFSITMDFPINSGAESEIIKHFEDQGKLEEEDFQNIIVDEKVIEILLKFNFHNVIYEFRNKVLIKIGQLEAKIKRQAERLDDILN